MPSHYLASVIDEPMFARRYRLTAGSGAVLAVLVAVISLGGLLGSSTYSRETTAWTQQALAQDWFDLLVAVPLLLVGAIWAGRGSRRGLLVYAGVLLFTLYTAVIYAFDVHFNSLFLVYCAVLGISLYALIGVAARLWQARDGLQVSMNIPRRSGSAFLIGVGVLFGALWLAQLIPALMAGRVPAEIEGVGLPTNPVHVMDLSFILPLHIIAGVALWRMKSVLALIAPILLVFGALMAASIAVLAAYAGGVGLAVAMGVLALASSVFAGRIVGALR